MIELAREAGFTLPASIPRRCADSCWWSMRPSLEDYLKRFELTIPLLQTPEAIERVAYEMVEDAARDDSATSRSATARS